MATATLAGQLWYQIVHTDKSKLISVRKNYQSPKRSWYKINYHKTQYDWVLFIPNPDDRERSYQDPLCIQLPSYNNIIPTIIREMQYDESNLFLAYFKRYGN